MLIELDKQVSVPDVVGPQLRLVLLQRNDLEERIVNAETDDSGLRVDDGSSSGLGLLPDAVADVSVSLRHDLQVGTGALGFEDHGVLPSRHDEQPVLVHALKHVPKRIRQITAISCTR